MEHDLTNLCVVKIGGAVLDDPEQSATLVARLTTLVADRPVVVIHGGGPQATRMTLALGHKPTIVDGRRVTDDLDLDIILATLCGQINAKLVSQLIGAGLNAAGLTGASGRTVVVTRRPPWMLKGREVDFGHVGDIDVINPALLTHLLEGGYTPVLATLGIDASGALHNVNGDTTAAQIAAALGARSLVLVTTSGGLLRDEQILPYCDRRLYDSGLEDGWITDGMGVKLLTGLNAIDSGISQVAIVSTKTLGRPDLGTQLLGSGDA